MGVKASFSSEARVEVGPFRKWPTRARLKEREMSFQFRAILREQCSYLDDGTNIGKGPWQTLTEASFFIFLRVEKGIHEEGLWGKCRLFTFQFCSLRCIFRAIVTIRHGKRRHLWTTTRVSTAEPAKRVLQFSFFWYVPRNSFLFFMQCFGICPSIFESCNTVREMLSRKNVEARDC